MDNLKNSIYLLKTEVLSKRFVKILDYCYDEYSVVCSHEFYLLDCITNKQFWYWGDPSNMIPVENNKLVETLYG